MSFENVRTSAGRGVRFTAAKPLRQVIPNDPAGARAGEVTVAVRVALDPAGKVTRAEIISRTAAAAREFEQLALKSARQWTFTPARRSDRRVASKAIIRYTFGNAVMADARLPR